MKYIGYGILIVAWIISIFEYGIGMIFAPLAALFILFLLLCGCKF